MGGFKLLSIRPLNDCSDRFTKVLSKGEFYTFYNDYKFRINNVGKVEVEYLNQSPEGLVTVPGVNHEIEVNISSIVGKNGAGKSTLFELYYLAIYYLAVTRNKPLLKPNLKSIDTEIKELENSEKSDSINAQNRIKYLGAEKKKIQEILNTFKVQIFFSIDDNIFELNTSKKNRSDENRGEVKVLKGDKWIKREIRLSKILDDEVFNPIDFAYTCVVNYSVHGLNALEIGSWINTLFHKNDAYRTPIVINPMRVNGDFEMDQENSLIRNRILSSLAVNIKSAENDFLGIKRKKLEGVKFKLKPNPNISGLRNLPDGNKEITYSYTSLYVDGEKAFESFLETLGNKLNLNVDEFIKGNHLLRYCLEYAFSKFNRIHHKYPLFRKSNIEEYMDVIISDDSHITLKFRQAINFIINDKFEKIKSAFFRDTSEKIDVLNIDKQQLGIKVEYSKSDFYKEFEGTKESEILSSLPPAIFDIELDLGSKVENDLSFLSSGEKHIIHSLQSIYYHLRNIDSMNQEELGYKYDHVNILLDEIELYQHPEMQKDYVKTILKGIEDQKLSKIKSVNILFSTHSPFILSDVMSSNILFLEKSKDTNGKSLPKKTNLPKTLGANIHELLAHSFFLSSGYMGNWATETILSLREYLLDTGAETDIKWDEKNSEKFIALLGEPIIKERLQSLYDEKFINSKDEIDLRIEKLKERKEKLSKK